MRYYNNSFQRSILCLFASASFLASTAMAQQLNRWDIGESKLSYFGTTATLFYPLSDLVPDGGARVLTFSDSDCTESIFGNEYLIPEVKWDENPNPDGTKNREVKVVYTIDYEKIKTAPVYTEIEQGQITISFCVSFVLLGDDGATPISALDTGVTIELDMDGDFGEQVEVNPNDRDEGLAEETYFVEGFLCDTDNRRILYSIPKSQGSQLRICVRPTEEAREDGVYMRRIDSFTFQRDGAQLGTKVSQVAIAGGEAVALTELTCERGTELCFFDTVLGSNFYFGPGTVYGFGEAWLQFGKETSRRLQLKVELPPQQEAPLESQSLVSSQQQHRSLRIEGGFAGSSYFNLNFFVIPSDDFTYQAEAYECDHKNRPVLNPKPKLPNESVRVCVRPDKEARSFGITMYGIESWNFTRNGVSQSAIDYQGVLAEDGLTMLHCISGSPLCSFRTQFTPELYQETDGFVDGFGTVLLQFASVTNSPSSAVGRRHLDEASMPVVPGIGNGVIPAGIAHNHLRMMQEDFGGDIQTELALGQTLAGRDDVNITTPIKFRPDDWEDPCIFEHEITEWWIEEDINDRYMYIGILVGTLIGVGLLLLCCWLLPNCIYNKEDTKEGGNQDVEVNVDIKQDEHQEQVTNIRKSKNLTRESQRMIEMGSDDTTDEDSSSRNDGLLRSDIEPSEDDVCFDKKGHPGTKKFRKLLKKIAKETEEDYCPAVYKAVKKNMKGSHFYVGKKGRFYEPEKAELVDLIGVAYSNALQGDSSRSLLHGMDDEDIEKPKSRKSMRKKQENFEDEIVTPRKSKKSNSRRSLMDEDEKPSSRKSLQKKRKSLRD